MYIYYAVYPTHPIATTISINYKTIDWLDIFLQWLAQWDYIIIWCY